MLNTGGQAPHGEAIIQKLKSFTFIFVFGIAAFGLAPSPAGAAVVYSYIGNNFTTFTDSTPVPAGTYDMTMQVTGSFTVMAPLLSLPSMTDISASVLSYSFSDGRQTLDNGNSTFGIFRMSSDAAGSPTAWQLDVISAFPVPSMVGDVSRRIITANEPPSTPFDLGNIIECTSIFVATGTCSSALGDDAIRRATPGTWTVTPAVVPLPPAVLLFGSGLVALFGFARAGGRRLRNV